MKYDMWSNEYHILTVDSLLLFAKQAKQAKYAVHHKSVHIPHIVHIVLNMYIVPMHICQICLICCICKKKKKRKGKVQLHSTTMKKDVTCSVEKARFKPRTLGYQVEHYYHCTTRPATYAQYDKMFMEQCPPLLFKYAKYAKYYVCNL